MSMWQPINDDAKDGNDILGWRPDCGQFMCRWTAPMDFMSDSELKKSGRTMAGPRSITSSGMAWMAYSAWTAIKRQSCGRRYPMILTSPNTVTNHGRETHD